MLINYSEDCHPGKEIKSYMDSAAKYILLNEDIDPNQIEISVTFVALDEIRKLNAQHRNCDVVTDVLSFPQYNSPESIKKELTREGVQMVHDDIYLTLGDVVICTDKVKEQAEYLGNSFERELVYLFTHSILHLLNYTHEGKEDYQKMRNVESMTMDEIGLGRNKPRE